MDGLRADDQGVHIQHAIECHNNVGNWAPAEEEKTRTIGIKPQGTLGRIIIRYESFRPNGFILQTNPAPSPPMYFYYEELAFRLLILPSLSYFA
jgi:hypothetical protein